MYSSYVYNLDFTKNKAFFVPNM